MECKSSSDLYIHMYASHQISLCITLVFILCLFKIWKSRTFLKSVEHLRLILFLTFNKSNLIQTWVHHISLNCVMGDSLICAIVNFFKLQPDFLKSNLRISARVNQAQDVVYIMWHDHVTWSRDNNLTNATLRHFSKRSQQILSPQKVMR